MQRSVMTWESYYIKSDAWLHQVVQTSIHSPSSRREVVQSLCFYFAEGLGKTLPRQKNLTNKESYEYLEARLN